MVSACFHGTFSTGAATWAKAIGEAFPGVAALEAVELRPPITKNVAKLQHVVSVMKEFQSRASSFTNV